MPVMMVAGIKCGSETAANLSVHYRGRRALFQVLRTLALTTFHGVSWIRYTTNRSSTLHRSPRR
jgi:hypothetical protein